MCIKCSLSYLFVLFTGIFRVIEKMQCVYQFEDFFCKCGKFMFNTADVSEEVRGEDFHFFWLKPQRDRAQNTILFDRIRRDGFSNSARCTFCSRIIGYFVFPFAPELEFIRFHARLLVMRKVCIVKNNSDEHSLEYGEFAIMC